MGAATLGFMGLSFTKPRTERIFHYITAGVTLVAALAYYSMASSTAIPTLYLAACSLNANISPLPTVSPLPRPRLLSPSHFLLLFCPTLFFPLHSAAQPHFLLHPINIAVHLSQLTSDLPIYRPRPSPNPSRVPPQQQRPRQRRRRLRRGHTRDLLRAVHRLGDYDAPPTPRPVAKRRGPMADDPGRGAGGRSDGRSGPPRRPNPYNLQMGFLDLRHRVFTVCGVRRRRSGPAVRASYWLRCEPYLQHYRPDAHVPLVPVSDRLGPRRGGERDPS